MRIRIAALAWLALAASANAARLPDVRFAAEQVKLEIVPGELRVEGRYGFVSADACTVAIHYPFPADPALGPPRLLAAECRRANAAPETLRVAETAIGWVWRLGFAARESCAVTVRYSQSLAAPRAVYVLTSTQAWGRPLDRARFEVSLPESLGPPRFSLPFRRAGCRDARCSWTCERRHFLPRRDLVVSWGASR
jgi:hypothetical protein